MNGLVTFENNTVVLGYIRYIANGIPYRIPDNGINYVTVAFHIPYPQFLAIAIISISLLVLLRHKNLIQFKLNNWATLIFIACFYGQAIRYSIDYSVSYIFSIFNDFNMTNPDWLIPTIIFLGFCYVTIKPTRNESKT